MGRAPCHNIKSGLKKGAWTPEEDHKLLSYIHDHGPKNWLSLPANAGLERCGKSCRLRWTNYLRPDIKRGRFSFEEEETIIQLHSILGNKWSAIASRLPGRTDNEIKNYWNTHIRKRLLQMGIDPVTHNRRLDLLDLSSLLTPLPYLSSFQTQVNPQLLQLATTLFALNHQNPDLLLQENQFYLPQMQTQNLTQQVPSYCATFDDDIPNLDQTQFMQYNVEGFASNSTQDSYIYGGSSPTDMCDQLGYSSFESLNNDCNNQDFSFGFVSLLDVKPLNSPSTFIGTSTEDEKESYCRSFLKFEYPENVNTVNEFM